MSLLFVTVSTIELIQSICVIRTNLPVETMGYPGYDFINRGRSFVTCDEVLEFFVSYANHYKIVEKVKFEHHVVRVRPIKNEKWEIIVRNLKRNVHETMEFDYVMVCNGHNSVVNMPKFPGCNTFAGRQLHSHNYRKSEGFEQSNVLIIGSGPSGIDLVYNISQKAMNVNLSTHRSVSGHNFPSNVIVKPDVSEIKLNSVVFADGSEENIDTILYCTGKIYSNNLMRSNYE